MLFVFSSVVSGAFMGLGWRDDSLTWLSVIGFGLFLLAQLRYRGLIACFAHGLLAGYIGYWVANPWIFWTVGGVMEMPRSRGLMITHLIHLVHGGSYAMFAVGWWAARKHLRSGWILAPAIWLICESVYPALFSMRQGCLILGVEPLVQIASVFGVPAATLQFFVIASLIPLFACWAFQISNGIDKTTARRFIVGILVLTAINFLWGSYRINRHEDQRNAFVGERLKVAIIQGDTEFASFHVKLMERSRKHAADCELVLWPECSLGKYNRELTEFTDSTNVAMNAVGMGFRFQPFPDPQCYLLAAGYSWDRKPGQTAFDSKYVSAYLLDPNERMVGRHDKIKLMPGGEYIPGKKWIPGMDQPIDEEDFDEIPLSRGLEARPIGVVGDSSIGVMLCCEDMYPELARDMTNRGADFLVCLANGMCFNSEVVLRQHFNISRFRAIENNRYFMRCGSFGVSCLVSPTGKILDSLPLFEEADLEVALPVEDRPLTLFSRFGDTLTWGSYLLIVGFIINSLFRRPPSKPEKDTSQLDAPPDAK